MVNSLADLPAPVGGVITFTTDGLYWINPTLNLAGNRLVVPLPRRIAITTDGVLWSVVGPVNGAIFTVQNGARLELRQAYIQNTTGGATARLIDNAGELIGVLSELRGGGTGILVQTSSTSYTRFARCQLRNALDGIAHTAGELEVANCDGSDFAGGQLVALRGNGASYIRILGGRTETSSWVFRVFAGGGCAMLTIANHQSTSLVGGFAQNTIGNIINRAEFLGNSCVTSPVFVDWGAAANVGPRGLLASGNFTAAVPLFSNGIDRLTARVLFRGNYGDLGPLSESPLVP